MPFARTDDGVDIHYHVDDFRDPWTTEPGESVLLTHGFARSMKWFAQWVPALSRRYSVVRYDVRGCGESSAPPPDAPWSADRLAKDALDLVDHLGIERVHCVGFESGGLWSQVFAIDHPERVMSLTVLNTPSTVAQRDITRLRGGFGRKSEVVEKLGLRRWLTDTFSTRIDMSMAPPGLMEWHIAEQCKTPLHVVLGVNSILETLTLAGKYSMIDAPTLIMVTEGSRNCPLEEQQVVRQQIPNARLVVLDGVAAGAHLLIPDRCTEEVLRFVEGL